MLLLTFLDTEQILPIFFIQKFWIYYKNSEIYYLRKKFAMIFVEYLRMN